MGDHQHDYDVRRVTSLNINQARARVDAAVVQLRATTLAEGE
jgi:hypothetical protein